MTRFWYGEDLWKAIGVRAKQAHSRKAAIAYFTHSTALPLRKGDVLVVDASDGAIACGQTSAAVLGTLRKKGVAVYSHNGLHAKIVVADDILFASSANVSDSSVNRLLEAGVETDSPNAVASAVGLFETLVECSTPVDKSFIDRIRTIEVVNGFRGSKSRARGRSEGQRNPVTWLVGVHDIDDPTEPGELERVEAGIRKAEPFRSNPGSSVSWIRYGPKMKIAKEAKRGDSLIVIHRPTDRAQPKRVYPHTTVLHRQREDKCTRVFYESAPRIEGKTLSWAEFKKLAALVRLPKNISKNTTRQITDKLSEDLKHHWKQVRRKRP